MKKIAITLFILVSIITLANFSIGRENKFHLTSYSISSEEDSILKYISDHKLNAIKTASGLYYVVEQQGNGEKVLAGQSVTVNYTGSFLNGKKFDSTTDPKFEHVEPINFVLGQGMVIKGWEEGIALFNVGGKGKLLIPSSLAYGENGAGETIAPYTPLLFEVEVLKVGKAKKIHHSKKNKSGTDC